MHCLAFPHTSSPYGHQLGPGRNTALVTADAAHIVVDKVKQSSLTMHVQAGGLKLTAITCAYATGYISNVSACLVSDVIILQAQNVPIPWLNPLLLHDNASGC